MASSKIPGSQKRGPKPSHDPNELEQKCKDHIRTLRLSAEEDLSDDESSNGVDWLKEGAPCPPEVQRQVHRYLHENNLYQVGSPDDPLFVGLVELVKSHAGLPNTRNWEQKVPDKCRGLIATSTRTWKRDGLLVTRYSVTRKTEVFQYLWDCAIQAASMTWSIDQTFSGSELGSTAGLAGEGRKRSAGSMQEAQSSVSPKRVRIAPENGGGDSIEADGEIFYVTSPERDVVEENTRDTTTVPPAAPPDGRHYPDGDIPLRAVTGLEPAVGTARAALSALGLAREDIQTTHEGVQVSEKKMNLNMATSTHGDPASLNPAADTRPGILPSGPPPSSYTSGPNQNPAVPPPTFNQNQGRPPPSLQNKWRSGPPPPPPSNSSQNHGQPPPPRPPLSSSSSSSSSSPSPPPDNSSQNRGPPPPPPPWPNGPPPPPPRNSSQNQGQAPPPRPPLSSSSSSPSPPPNNSSQNRGPPPPPPPWPNGPPPPPPRNLSQNQGQAPPPPHGWPNGPPPPPRPNLNLSQRSPPPRPPVSSPSSSPSPPHNSSQNRGPPPPPPPWPNGPPPPPPRNTSQNQGQVPPPPPDWPSQNRGPPPPPPISQNAKLNPPPLYPPSPNKAPGPPPLPTSQNAWPNRPPPPPSWSSQSQGPPPPPPAWPNVPTPPQSLSSQNRGPPPPPPPVSQNSRPNPPPLHPPSTNKPQGPPPPPTTQNGWPNGPPPPPRRVTNPNHSPPPAPPSPGSPRNLYQNQGPPPPPISHNAWSNGPPPPPRTFPPNQASSPIPAPPKVGLKDGPSSSPPTGSNQTHGPPSPPRHPVSSQNRSYSGPQPPSPTPVQDNGLHGPESLETIALWKKFDERVIVHVSAHVATGTNVLPTHQFPARDVFKHTVEFLFQWIASMLGISPPPQLVFEFFDVHSRVERGLILPQGDYMFLKAMKVLAWEHFKGIASRDPEVPTVNILIRPIFPPTLGSENMPQQSPQLHSENTPSNFASDPPAYPPLRNQTGSSISPDSAGLQSAVQPRRPPPFGPPPPQSQGSFPISPAHNAVHSFGHLSRSASSPMSTTQPKNSPQTPNSNNPDPQRKPPQHSAQRPAPPLTKPDAITSATANIVIRIQIDGHGHLSHSYDKSTLNARVTSARFFAWFAQETGRTSSGKLRFDFKDSLPARSSVIVVGNDDHFDLMVRDIRRKFERAKEFVPDLSEFCIVVTDPEWDSGDEDEDMEG